MSTAEANNQKLEPSLATPSASEGGSAPSNLMSEATSDEKDKYITFEIGDKRFAVSLLDVREVIEMVEIVEVPNVVDSVEGVCNLRGQIIVCVSLAKRFKLPKTSSERPILVIVETKAGLMGAVADSINKVVAIPSEQIESGETITLSVPEPYVLGIGKTEMGITTILDLKAILDEQTMKTVKQAVA